MSSESLTRRQFLFISGAAATTIFASGCSPLTTRQQEQTPTTEANNRVLEQLVLDLQTRIKTDNSPSADLFKESTIIFFDQVPTFQGLPEDIEEILVHSSILGPKQDTIAVVTTEKGLDFYPNQSNVITADLFSRRLHLDPARPEDSYAETYFGVVYKSMQVETQALTSFALFNGQDLPQLPNSLSISASIEAQYIEHRFNHRWGELPSPIARSNQRIRLSDPIDQRRSVILRKSVTRILEDKNSSLLENAEISISYGQTGRIESVPISQLSEVQDFVMEIVRSAS